MKRILFIINPISGTKNKANLIDLIENKVNKSVFCVDVVYTEYAGHASELAKKAVEEGIDIVVAVGGDGTVNEVARSLADSDTALAIIPLGSGNGLARDLGLPISVEKSIDVINKAHVSAIDYGVVNGMKFFCTCGVGFDALISLKFSQAGKRGVITYLEQTLHQYLNYKPETYQIETEEGVSTFDAFLVACANASQYGNNAYIAPTAKLTDGYFDIIILKPFSVIDIPALSLMLFSKTIDKNSNIKVIRCKSIKIKREKEGVMHCDGDPIEASSEIDIHIVEKGLKVIIPDSNKKDKKKNKIELKKITLQDIRDFGRSILNKK